MSSKTERLTALLLIFIGAIVLAAPKVDVPGVRTVQDEGTPVTFRGTINFAGAGVTCADDTDRTTCTIPGGGGSSSGPAADAGYLIWDITASTGSPNERVLTAGTAISFDSTTPGQLIINASAGGMNTSTDTVTFATNAYDATKTVAAAWATASSIITCVSLGEEASIEGIDVQVISRDAGSFVVRAEPRAGRHTGALPFNCIGN